MKSADQLLREYIAFLRVEKGLARNTTSAYERDLTRFIEFLDESEILVANLSTADFQEYVANLRGKGGGAQSREQLLRFVTSTPSSHERRVSLIL